MNRIEDILYQIDDAINTGVSIVLFGSALWEERPKDYDILVVLDGGSFVTPKRYYTSLGNCIKNIASRNGFPLDVVVKSKSEFTEDNLVTLTPGFLQHLHNNSRLIMGDNNLKRNISEMYGATKEDRPLSIQYSSAAEGLEVRKQLLNSLIDTKYQPTLSKRFFQSAVRSVLGHEVLPDEESQIVDIFYGIVDPHNVENRLREFNNVLSDDRLNYVTIIEEAAWMLNEYLLNKETVKSLFCV